MKESKMQSIKIGEKILNRYSISKRNLASKTKVKNKTDISSFHQSHELTDSAHKCFKNLCAQAVLSNKFDYVTDLYEGFVEYFETSHFSLTEKKIFEQDVKDLKEALIRVQETINGKQDRYFSYPRILNHSKICNALVGISTWKNDFGAFWGGFSNKNFVSGTQFTKSALALLEDIESGSLIHIFEDIIERNKISPKQSKEQVPSIDHKTKKHNQVLRLPNETENKVLSQEIESERNIKSLKRAESPTAHHPISKLFKEVQNSIAKVLSIAIQRPDFDEKSFSHFIFLIVRTCSELSLSPQEILETLKTSSPIFSFLWENYHSEMNFCLNKLYKISRSKEFIHNSEVGFLHKNILLFIGKNKVPPKDCSVFYI